MRALAVLAVFAVGAAAQQPLEYKVTVQGEIVKGSRADHFLTFTTPMQIPDAMLPPGTYIFTITASSVVQVATADRSEYLAQFFTVPVNRVEPGENYEVTVVRDTAASPRRITKWFLPYQPMGFEFLYAGEGVRGAR
jgi:hypothetical protein